MFWDGFGVVLDGLGVVWVLLHLYWNFEPFVSALKDSYRDELKTPSRDVLGAHFGPKKH